MEVIQVNATSVLASSPSVNIDDNVSIYTSDSTNQLGREEYPSNPNIWEQGW